MARQLLPHDVTPEDRARGCFWASTFRRNGDEVAKQGTINGAPTIDHGVTLSGAQWINYGLFGQFDGKDPYSFHAVFYPSFAFADSSNHYLFDGLATLNYTMRKTATNLLQFRCGGVAISAGDVSAQWVQNGRNVFTVASTSGATDAWFNGVQVVTADASAWTPTVITQLHVGQRSNASDRWPGRIEMLKFYGTYLQTELDHQAIWAGGGA